MNMYFDVTKVKIYYHNYQFYTKFVSFIYLIQYFEYSKHRELSTSIFKDYFLEAIPQTIHLHNQRRKGSSVFIINSTCNFDIKYKLFISFFYVCTNRKVFNALQPVFFLLYLAQNVLTTFKQCARLLFFLLQIFEK